MPAEESTGSEPGHIPARNCNPGKTPKRVSTIHDPQDAHTRRASFDIGLAGLRRPCTRRRHSRRRNPRRETPEDSASNRQAANTGSRTGRPSATDEMPAVRLPASSPRRALANRCNSFRNAYIRTTIRTRTRLRHPTLPHRPSPIPDTARIASSLYDYQICRFVTTHSPEAAAKFPNRSRSLPTQTNLPHRFSIRKKISTGSGLEIELHFQPPTNSALETRNA